MYIYINGWLDGCMYVCNDFSALRRNMLVLFFSANSMFGMPCWQGAWDIMWWWQWGQSICKRAIISTMTISSPPLSLLSHSLICRHAAEAPSAWTAKDGQLNWRSAKKQRKTSAWRWKKWRWCSKETWWLLSGKTSAPSPSSPPTSSPSWALHFVRLAEVRLNYIFS